MSSRVWIRCCGSALKECWFVIYEKPCIDAFLRDGCGSTDSDPSPKENLKLSVILSFGCGSGVADPVQEKQGVGSLCAVKPHIDVFQKLLRLHFLALILSKSPRIRNANPG
jgi:hypothetical protein